MADRGLLAFQMPTDPNEADSIPPSQRGRYASLTPSASSINADPIWA